MSFHLDISVSFVGSVFRPFILTILVCISLENGIEASGLSSVSTETVLFLDEVEASRDMFQKPVFLAILSLATASATCSSKISFRNEQLWLRVHLGGTCTTLQLERRTRVLELDTGCFEHWQAAELCIIQLFL